MHSLIMLVSGEVMYSVTSLIYLEGLISGPIAQSVLMLFICRSTSLKVTSRSKKESPLWSERELISFRRFSIEDDPVPSILWVVSLKCMFNSSASARIGFELGLKIRWICAIVLLVLSMAVLSGRMIASGACLIFVLSKVRTSLRAVTVLWRLVKVAWLVACMQNVLSSLVPSLSLIYDVMTEWPLEWQ